MLFTINYNIAEQCHSRYLYIRRNGIRGDGIWGNGFGGRGRILGEQHSLIYKPPRDLWLRLCLHIESCANRLLWRHLFFTICNSTAWKTTDKQTDNLKHFFSRSIAHFTPSSSSEHVARRRYGEMSNMKKNYVRASGCETYKIANLKWSLNEWSMAISSVLRMFVCGKTLATEHGSLRNSAFYSSGNCPNMEKPWTIKNVLTSVLLLLLYDIGDHNRRHQHQRNRRTTNHWNLYHTLKVNFLEFENCVILS